MKTCLLIMAVLLSSLGFAQDITNINKIVNQASPVPCESECYGPYAVTVYTKASRCFRGQYHERYKNLEDAKAAAWKLYKSYYSFKFDAGISTEEQKYCEKNETQPTSLFVREVKVTGYLGIDECKAHELIGGEEYFHDK